MRDFLDGLGIRASSSHDGISADPAALRTKLENAVTLGQKYVVVPYLNSTSLSEWQTWADQMNAEAAVAKRYGLRYGYHNHAHEFTIDLGGGLTPWEVLTSRLDRKLVHLEVDLYWAYTGGVNTGAADPDQFAIDVIREAPQKVRQFHVKDRDAATGATCATSAPVSSTSRGSSAATRSRSTSSRTTPPTSRPSPAPPSGTSTSTT